MILQIQHPDGRREERAWTPDWESMPEKVRYISLLPDGMRCEFVKRAYPLIEGMGRFWSGDAQCSTEPSWCEGVEMYYVDIPKDAKITNWRDTLHCRRPQTWADVPDPDWDAAPQEAQWAVLIADVQRWNFLPDRPRYGKHSQGELSWWASDRGRIGHQTIGDGQSRDDPEWTELVRTSLRERPKAGNKRIYPQSLLEAEVRRLTKEMEMGCVIHDEQDTEVNSKAAAHLIRIAERIQEMQKRKPSQYYCFAVDQDDAVDYARIVRENADAQAVAVAQGNRAVVVLPRAHESVSLRLDGKDLRSLYVKEKQLWILEELRKNKHGFLTREAFWSPRVARRLARLYAARQGQRVVRVNAYMGEE